MTGPEHYREAEYAMTAIGACRNPDPACALCAHIAMKAQVHATLAAAAATADLFAGDVTTRAQAWIEATR